MKKAEKRLLKGEVDDSSQKIEVKNGTVSDMLLPLGISVLMLFILGIWNYTLVPFLGVEGVSLGGNEMLILSFSIGLIIAFFKYTSSKIMTPTEFLDTALEGTKSAVIGGMIIILAVTLGDLMRASAPEGLGAAQYVGEIAQGMPAQIVPMLVFIIGSAMGFAMGTSWGVWGMLMPIAIPLTLSVGGNPFVAAAAVLSGGTFGDHCSPISDTTIMSSIGAGCDHMDHVNTQIPYALSAAAVASALFLIVGFIA